jgi:peptide/nickel transport system substrate-binding protein
MNQLYGACCGPWPNYGEYTVYQPLVYDNGTAQYQDNIIQYTPGLASNWTVSPDQTTWTFQLRQNVHFSDGRPFNAYQAWMEEYGFYYLSANSSGWWDGGMTIFNMSNVRFGPATIALINQSDLIHPSQSALSVMMNSSWPIYVTGPYTIVFHLGGPFVWFPGTLLAFCGLMFDAQYVLDHGGFGTPTSINTLFNQNPIPGSGPYVVTQWQENSLIKFTQDQNYWALSLPPSTFVQQPYMDPGHAKNVIIQYKPDDISRYTDLSNGASQFSDIGPSDWNLVTANPHFSYVKGPAGGPQSFMMTINTRIFPTNITLVRQAIVHAINDSDIAQKAFAGQITPFVGPEYPLWSQFYDLGNFTPYSYNLTLAKQDLVAAHYNSSLPITLKIVSDCIMCTSTAEVIQSDLAQIGITVNIEVLTSSALYAPLGSFSTDIANAQQIGQLALEDGGPSYAPYGVTPYDYWVAFVSNQSAYPNWAIYYNPIVQKCVNSFTQTANISYIQSLCRSAQAQVYSDAPYYWIGISRLWVPTGGSTVYNRNVISGFLLDPIGGGQSSIPIFNTVTFA